MLVRLGKGKFKNQWALPGGGVRIRETIDEAAKREVLEEAGITISDLRVVSIGELMDDDEHRFTIILSARADSSILKKGSEELEAKWFPENEAYQKSILFTQMALDCQKKGKIFFHCYYTKDYYKKIRKI